VRTAEAVARVWLFVCSCVGAWHIGFSTGGHIYDRWDGRHS
jgi:hypothetical protein